MQAIRAGFGHHVYHSGRGLPVLRAVVAGLDAELLQRIWHRQRLIYIAQDILTMHPIKPVTHVIGAPAVDRDGHGAWECLGRPLVASVGGSAHRAGHQCCQLRGIPAVERQFDHAAGIDHLPQCTGRRIHLHSGCLHVHYFRGGSQLELDVKSNAVVGQ